MTSTRSAEDGGTLVLRHEMCCYIDGRTTPCLDDVVLVDAREAARHSGSRVFLFQVTLKWDETERFIMRLRMSRSYSRVILVGCVSEPGVIRRFAEALPWMGVTDFEMDDILSAGQVHELALGLRGNCTLEELRLSSRAFYPPDSEAGVLMSDSVAKELTDALITTNVRSLRLTFQLRANAWNDLARAVRAMSLRDLDVGTLAASRDYPLPILSALVGNTSINSLAIYGLFDGRGRNRAEVAVRGLCEVLDTSSVARLIYNHGNNELTSDQMLRLTVSYVLSRNWAAFSDGPFVRQNGGRARDLRRGINVLGEGKSALGRLHEELKWRVLTLVVNAELVGAVRSRAREMGRDVFARA